MSFIHQRTGSHVGGGCEAENLLASFICVGSNPVMTDENYCCSRVGLPQVARLAFFKHKLGGLFTGEEQSLQNGSLSETAVDKLQPFAS